MNGLFEAAREVTEFMASRGWKFCLIGGLAVQQWGEPRTTLDVDFTLLTDWGEETRYIDAILERFESRLPNARTFAMQNRVLLIRASNGKDVDIALGALPFEVRMMERAESVEFAPGISLPCCTAEDLFVMKGFAGRDRDWVDSRSIAARQPQLDHAYILEQLADLASLRDNDEALNRAREILESPT